MQEQQGKVDMISKETELHLDTITKAKVTIKTAERYSTLDSIQVSTLYRNSKKSKEKIKSLEQEIEKNDQSIVDVKVLMDIMIVYLFNAF